MNNSTTPKDGDRDKIIGFLLGENDIDGYWFGEEYPDKKGMFWWRSLIREALSASPQQDPLKSAEEILQSHLDKINIGNSTPIELCYDAILKAMTEYRNLPAVGGVQGDFNGDTIEKLSLMSYPINEDINCKDENKSQRTAFVVGYKYCINNLKKV